MNIAESKGDRSYQTAKILQFGEGNFLRAFVDWMVDYSNKSAGTSTGVTIVQPLAEGMIDILNEQNGLYTVIENGIKGNNVIENDRVVEAIVEGINPYKDFSRFLETAREETYEIVVSNTTEAGIEFVGSDTFNDEPPSSYPGKLTRWLYERYLKFQGDPTKGVVILPCELIESNGEKLKDVILQYANLWQLESGFVSWLDQSNTICNTLVDRIVPGYPRHKIDELTRKLGYEDKLIVETEPYYVWVIQGADSVREQLPFVKDLNIIYTDELSKYRTRKVRLLNGPHTTMVPIGLLYGLYTVKQVVDHKVVGPFIEKAIQNEMIPVIDMEESELVQYAQDVLDRFRNPFVKHKLISIALNSHSKYRTRVLPTVKDYLRVEGELPKRLVFALAATFRLFKGEVGGLPITLQEDPKILETYKRLWTLFDEDKITIDSLVEELLAMENVWGEDLNKIPDLSKTTAEYVKLIHNEGMKKAIEQLT